jgi:hypothetical protein
MRNLIANGSAQHRVSRLKRIHYGQKRRLARHINLNLSGDARQCPQMRR